MPNESAIVFSGIAPHPPIMVPEVGGESIAQVRGSIDAMAELTRRVIESRAETVVLISPHAPLDPYAFVAYEGPSLYGDFANFRAPTTSVEAFLNQELLASIATAAADEEFAVVNIGDYQLDHGTAVPLYFLHRNGWNGRVVALGYSFLSNEDHLKFGACVRKAVDQVGRPTAFIASGDLSHRLKPGAPAGYNPTAHVFDNQVVELLRANSPEGIIDIDQDLRRTAGECGYRSILMAVGAMRQSKPACEVLHYEAPFGVGYLVAQLTNIKATSENTPTKQAKETPDRRESRGNDLPALARKAVETFVRTGTQIAAPQNARGLLSERAACFVSIKTLNGDLRGCIGTIEPAKDSLAEELVMNAISAAMRDPRFPPVSENELENLRYSVDVLATPEPARFEDLDPAVYGVIVEDDSGLYRGLLLPDIEGVDSAAKQVEIAARKGGISPDAKLKLSRFRVDRFREVTA